MVDGEIGRRVGAAIGAGRSQGSVAAAVGMTRDAFSRSINGKRAFTSVELARIGDELGADVHMLITGRPDPLRAQVVARHDYDHATGLRSVPGRDADDAVLDRIALAYRQAYPHAERPSRRLPASAAEVGALLANEPVRYFADQVEAAADVDVVRVPDLSTDYSIVIGGRNIVVLGSTGNWFRSNWSLAHELGHLALSHHGTSTSASNEAAANAFAAELLLPRSILESIEWQQMTESRLAQLLWEWGVSSEALSRRLDSLGITVPDVIAATLGQPTQRVLRLHRAIARADGVDEVTKRMNDAAARRFPLHLLDAHTTRIEEGGLAPGTLAWMLDMPEQDLVIDRPDPPHAGADELAGLLGF